MGSTLLLQRVIYIGACRGDGFKDSTRPQIDWLIYFF